MLAVRGYVQVFAQVCTSVNCKLVLARHNRDDNCRLYKIFPHFVSRPPVLIQSERAYAQVLSAPRVLSDGRTSLKLSALFDCLTQFTNHPQTQLACLMPAWILLLSTVVTKALLSRKFWQLI